MRRVLAKSSSREEMERLREVQRDTLLQQTVPKQRLANTQVCVEPLVRKLRLIEHLQSCVQAASPAMR